MNPHNDYRTLDPVHDADEIRSLLALYWLQELTDDDQTAIAELVRTQPAWRELSEREARLLNLVRAAGQPQSASGIRVAHTAAGHPQPEKRRPSSRRRRAGSARHARSVSHRRASLSARHHRRQSVAAPIAVSAGIAAALAVAFLIFVASSPDAVPQENTATRRSEPIGRSLTVAVLTGRATATDQSGSRRQVRIGDRLGSDETLNVESGWTQLSVGRAKVFAQADTRLRTTTDALRLEAGTVVVDDAGEGLAVTTDVGRAAPVGTLFAVQADAGRMDVGVCRGSVDLQIDGDGGAIALQAGWGGRIEGDGGIGSPAMLSDLNWDWVPVRRTDGLVAEYRFFGSGAVVRDEIREPEALDMRIVDPGGHVKWLPQGGLRFRGEDHNAIATVQVPSDKIYRRLTDADRVTIEVWFRPRNVEQHGPARIIHHEHPEGHPANRWNWMVGQGHSGVVFRLRTTEPERHTSTYCLTGQGVLQAGKLHHVVCTFAPGDGLRVYVDGRQQAHTPDVGTLERTGPCAWGDDFYLSVGNRITSLDRDWQGDLLFASVHARHFSATEVLHHHWLGVPDGSNDQP